MSHRFIRDVTRRNRSIAAFGLLIFVALAIFGITRNARQVALEIDTLASANSDSPQWTLSQIEVEYDRMRLALLSAQPDDPDSVDEFGRRFDIFYSRIQTVSEGSGFRAILRNEGGAKPLASIQLFLDHTAARLDAQQPFTTQMKAQIESEARSAEGDLRALALTGLAIFSEQIKDQRELVFAALVKLAVMTLVLFAILAVSAVALWILWRFGQQKAVSLRDAMTRITAVVNASVDAVIVADEQSRILEFNGAAESILGCSKGEAIGASLEEFVVLPEDLQPRRGLLELQAKRANGDEFPAELSMREAQVHSGKLRVIYLRDISRRVAANAELIAARDRALAGEREKSRFVSVMSHELRTPLNGLLGSLELIRDTQLDERQASFVEAMEFAGKSLLHHVNDVLDVERLDAGKLELAKIDFDPYSLVVDVATTLRPAATGRGNSLSVEATNSIPKAVIGDPARLRQVLMNIIGNGIKFTRNGVVQIELEYAMAGQSLEIRVIDSGIGISRADQERIFDDFVSILPVGAQDISGTGLGLGIVRRLLKAMGGEIRVESEPGEGTVFWFSLPAPCAIVRHSADHQAKDAAPPPPVPPRDILIVEDNALNREVLRQMLLQGQHRVTMAIDGQDGVDAARKQKFDLILMDLNMPVLDGMQATRIIRAGEGPNSDTTIVAVTANISREAAADLQAAGCDDVVCKPINRAALNRLLQAHHRPSAQAGTPGDEFVDQSTRDDLLEMYGPAEFATLQEAFLQEGRRRISALQQHLMYGDLEAYAGVAHQLAGSAGILGLQKLHKLLKIHENAARAEEKETLSQQMEDLLDLWVRVEELIQGAAARTAGWSGASETPLARTGSKLLH
ncbi:ATP-binding protein (plasmid) [Thioclava litoralis]|uniref:histidine kinase n=1 Tax=Thioclava litoralis TaxID=3076557 RepID=A0ABZ1E514_9RHOB|nr:ATP-binding protein [Thioclava sp. FTW29]